MSDCVARPRSAARCCVLGLARMPAYERDLRPCITLADRTRATKPHYVKAPEPHASRVRMRLWSTMADDLHTLSAPYALDALSPDERAQFEEHLRTCDRCQA